MTLVYNAFPPKSYDFLTWPACELLLPHALTASEHSERLKVAPDATGGLLNNIGPYLDERADYDGTRSVFERALKIFEQAYGPDHSKVARTVSNLGNVLLCMGDFEGAKKLHERALKIEEQAYGLDHPSVGIIVENLGIALGDMGDFEGAKNRLVRALAIFRNRLGEEHPHTVKARNNLDALEREMKCEG